MKRALIMAIGVAMLTVGAWYRAHRDVATAKATPTAGTAVRGAPPTGVTPDKSWADLFDALDQQWNHESKAPVPAVSPTTNTRRTPPTTDK